MPCPPPHPSTRRTPISAVLGSTVNAAGWSAWNSSWTPPPGSWPRSATTNAIATRAGISPGSLYQYFSSKEDIASALWERYAERLSAIVDDEALTRPDLPPEEVVNRIIDPVHALKTANRDFAQLYARTSADELESVARAHTEFHRRLVDVLAARNPKVSRTELADVAAIVSAMFSTTVTSETLTGDPTKDLAEMKRAILAYMGARGLR